METAFSRLSTHHGLSNTIIPYHETVHAGVLLVFEKHSILIGNTTSGPQRASKTIWCWAYIPLLHLPKHEFVSNPLFKSRRIRGRSPWMRSLPV